MNRTLRQNFQGSQNSNNNNPIILSQSQAECPICLQVVKVRGKIPCCNHIFCYTCIFEWSRVTNSCPLCKKTFHEIERFELNGGKWKEDNRRRIIQVKDKKQENDVIVQEFLYEDCPFLNEYVEDDFLVSDDAPILYETQVTASSSLVNLQHYDTLSRSPLSLHLESDSSPPRRPLLSQSQRLEELIRRRRRRVIPSDNEEEPDASPSTPIGSPRLIHSSVSTPVLFPNQPNLRTEEPFRVVDVCADSAEDLNGTIGSREVCWNWANHISAKRGYGDKEKNGLVIIPETPIRERRCKNEPDRFLREKLSHML